ncbi:helix-turn-helix domain-containing protein [Jiangella mangrovi]|uniref:HTH araC/xylS-type domain-containing protein n=1 Tax=Jiangella mangrovi TaxID=1524084 RepID=A0A7W9LJ98_9ACTN|nr:helix-turn-helix domain-containing protein [Jiangella mangrovi]MBB5785802.1 hypothetical protein [Jiangella mangrovi]
MATMRWAPDTKWERMSLTMQTVAGPAGQVARIWTARCERPADFSSIASFTPGIGFARIGGTTIANIRGPATRATTLSCPEGAEYFGVDFRVGAYLPMIPFAPLMNLHQAALPTLTGGRILIDGRAWELPTPQNLDVFVARLERSGLLVFDPLVEELRHDGGAVRSVAERTAQSRFLRAVGLSRRALRLIERTRDAARLLRAGTAIADVVAATGFYDQPQLTRAVRRLIGHTPAELRRGGVFLDL